MGNGSGEEGRVKKKKQSTTDGGTGVDSNGPRRWNRMPRASKGFADEQRLVGSSENWEVVGIHLAGHRGQRHFSLREFKFRKGHQDPMHDNRISRGAVKRLEAKK